MKLNRLARKPPYRKPRQTFLIVCEDEKIEPRYFEEFIRAKRITSVNIIGCGASPSKVVERALVEKRKNNYDLVWCVFDVEAPTPHHDLDEAWQMALGKSHLKVIITNPCFEYWFLLHYRKTAQLMNSNEDVYRLLVKEYPDFEKANDNIISYLMADEKTTAAINNAKAIIVEKNYVCDFGYDLRKCNPSTHVHFLVQELNTLTPQY